MPAQRKSSTSKNTERTSPAPAVFPLPMPVVSQKGGVMVMHFESDYIQSQMLVDDPDFLALAYTRTMMAFEVFTPLPREIALIGLGGGSLAKWCYRHHLETRLTVVEINPHVIALGDVFHVPRADERLRILCEDGAKFVEQTAHRFDVLLVDCFSEDNLPPELCSQKFYDDCKGALTASGLMVANLCGKDHRDVLSRIRKSFGGKVLLSTDKDGNTVVFACKGELLWPKNESTGSLRKRLQSFERKYRLGRALAPST